MSPNETSPALATTSVQIVNPVTAELVELDGPTERLGEFLADVREFESLLREAKKAVSREILRRQDLEGKWTTVAGAFKLTGQSPAPSEEFDAANLYSDLCALVDDGVITMDAVNRAVVIEHVYKPQKRGIQALRKLGGRVARVVDGCSREVERERRVSVSRA